MDERRLRRLIIPERAIVDLLNGHITFDKIDLPDDARAVGAYAEWAHKGIGVVVESATFDEVEAGAEIPLLPLLLGIRRRP